MRYCGGGVGHLYMRAIEVWLAETGWGADDALTSSPEDLDISSEAGTTKMKVHVTAMKTIAMKTLRTNLHPTREIPRRTALRSPRTQTIARIGITISCTQPMEIMEKPWMASSGSLACSTEIGNAFRTFCISIYRISVLFSDCPSDLGALSSCHRVT